MAQIVAAMAMTHSPGLTGWFDRASKEYQEQALRAMTEMRERLAAARPDVVVVFSNDHLLNWPINNTPEFTVGIDGRARRSRRLVRRVAGASTKYTIPGQPALARYIVNEGARRRIAFSYLRDMQFDDGISVPMHYLNPSAAIPLVPVTMNCTVPPDSHPGPRLRGRHDTPRDAQGLSRPRSASPCSPRAGSPTSRAARATSGWTRSSISGSSTS